MKPVTLLTGGFFGLLLAVVGVFAAKPPGVPIDPAVDCRETPRATQESVLPDDGSGALQRACDDVRGGYELLHVGPRLVPETPEGSWESCEVPEGVLILPQHLTAPAEEVPVPAELPIIDPVLVGALQRVRLGWVGPHPYVWVEMPEAEPLTEETAEPPLADPQEEEIPVLTLPEKELYLDRLGKAEGTHYRDSRMHFRSGRTGVDPLGPWGLRLMVNGIPLQVWHSLREREVSVAGAVNRAAEDKWANAIEFFGYETFHRLTRCELDPYGPKGVRLMVGRVSLQVPSRGFPWVPLAPAAAVADRSIRTFLDWAGE
ncbi:MAG TPA: hypothetical protein VIL46_11775 [Gemmataceae bacterium]